LLLYVIYSYVLYAFFIHFNRLFLIYIGALACAFYAFVGSLAGNARPPIEERKFTLASNVLIACSILFALLWLTEIVPALLRDTAPPSLAEVGLIVNPVHVLDLAFVLPAMLVTALLLRRRHALGVLLATPILTFSVVMGIAIELMFFFLRRAGLPAPLAPAFIMAIVILATAWAASSILSAREFSRS
jgi:hypothetical protein